MADQVITNSHAHALAELIDEGPAIVGRNIRWVCACKVAGISSSIEWAYKDHARHILTTETDLLHAPR